jgi:heptosyltransferase-1
LDYGLDVNNFKNETEQGSYLVFLHATSWKTKLWAVSNWIKLAELAGKQGYKVLLPWGNAEEKYRALEIQGKVDNAVVLPHLNLHGIAKILANASAIVGLDTGLAHLGAALNIPGITLYFATSPALTGAMGYQQICLSQHEGEGVAETQEKLAGTVYINEITAEIIWNTLKNKLL